MQFSSHVYNIYLFFFFAFIIKICPSRTKVARDTNKPKRNPRDSCMQLVRWVCPRDLGGHQAIRPVFGHVDPGAVSIVHVVHVYDHEHIPSDLVVDLHICRRHSVCISILPVTSEMNQYTRIDSHIRHIHNSENPWHRTT